MGSLTSSGRSNSSSEGWREKGYGQGPGDGSLVGKGEFLSDIGPQFLGLNESHTTETHENDSTVNLEEPNGEISTDQEATEKLELEWDFLLPVIPLQTNNLGTISLEEFEAFDIRVLVAAIQNGLSLNLIQNYLSRFDQAKVSEEVNKEVDGFPVMFYAVETNNEKMLRTLVKHGGDTLVIHEGSNIPLLAFAIMHSENIQRDTTIMTATLLSFGASPDVIPSAFYTPYLQDLPETGPSDDALKDLDSAKQTWCKGAARTKLARTTTLSQRYYLERASKTKKPSVRQTQVAQKRNAEPLLGIANFLIGQNGASKLLLDKLLSHLTVPSKKPLVLVFAGPSGHGKTELARCLGTLLSLELEVVDCTIFNRENELFGPRQPYVGWEKGSRLNNFLTRNHNNSCIVFLDEFEKTNADIHKTLLLPFENGEYQDRRALTRINCSKTIWILATNAHDSIIKDFWTDNGSIFSLDDEEPKKQPLLKQLSKNIKTDFLSQHGAPVTGRISGFIPFLPFSKGEQAVIVHKNLLDLSRRIRMPVNLMEGSEEQLIGDMRMRIRRDASVCGILAESEYHIDLGARSLIGAVDAIKTLLVEGYLSVEEEIAEGRDITDVIIEANDGEVVVNIAPPKSW
ncbi:hypothetical protein HYFRA_00001705 [Hymenoscyphus fraxineus]|uniref:AAA+ ATPase domain-containing protein n=1 Tax=Hymenoscyphus fraxineus TaxID=746836 RepID=A0A9N9PZJ9_9HELO|nr:hypothetical protein HYFRA_00001705 [Hymenoscyphus fraxineus]